MEDTETQSDSKKWVMSMMPRVSISNELVCHNSAPNVSSFEFNPHCDFYEHLKLEASKSFEFKPIYEQRSSAGKIKSMRLGVAKPKFRTSLATINEVDSRIRSIVTYCNHDRSLCEAVFKNAMNTVRTLLNLGVSPNCYDEHKRTPLHIAVSKGYCEMVQLLLNHKADPNMKDGLGNSCLHLAACTINVEIALILIKGGASVHLVDIRGRSPIQLAQSKLRILQRNPDVLVKSKVTQVIDMLLLYLKKSSEKPESKEESDLLSSFQNRLKITDTPEQISNEIDNLSKVLNEMESLTIK